MHFISEQDRKRISDAIQQVESKTCGELVTVIAKSSDDYTYIPLLWAALVALVLPGPFIFFDVSWFTESMYLYQMASFIVSVLVFRIPFIRFRLIPVAVRQRRAHRHAMEQFVINNLASLQKSNGVLLFVSAAEHYVEIIADKGVNDLVADETWDNIVKGFSQQVKKGAVAEGFIGAIQQCGEILHEHFPSDGDNNNELADHLIMV